MQRDCYLMAADEFLFSEFDRWCEVSRAYAAARRALGIVNRLRPGQTRARHVSRVMANLNRCRAEFKKYQTIFEGLRR